MKAKYTFCGAELGVSKLEKDLGLLVDNRLNSSSKQCQALYLFTGSINTITTLSNTATAASGVCSPLLVANKQCGGRGAGGGPEKINKVDGKGGDLGPNLSGEVEETKYVHVGEENTEREHRTRGDSKYW